MKKIIKGGEHLLQKKCVPCEAGTPPLGKTEADKYLKQLKNVWEKVDGIKIKYRFKLKTFRDAVTFVNKIADLAEEEGHHPNIFISYNNVTITLITHAIGGLSENDFILAAKIEKLLD